MQIGGQESASNKVERNVPIALSLWGFTKRKGYKKACLPPGRMQVMAAAVEDTDKSLRELDSQEFYPFLEGAGEKLVIVDFYTDW